MSALWIHKGMLKINSSNYADSIAFACTLAPVARSDEEGRASIRDADGDGRQPGRRESLRADGI